MQIALQGVQEVVDQEVHEDSSVRALFIAHAATYMTLLEAISPY